MRLERRAILVRLPPSVYDAIGIAAVRECRSVNAEILWAIRCYLASRGLDPSTVSDQNDSEMQASA